MKTTITMLLLFLFIFTSFGQEKKRAQVKRKYQKVDATSKKAPKVFLSGMVYDENYRLIPGASVILDGMSKSLNTNEDGEYFFTGLVEGRTRVRVSHVGYKTHTADIILTGGKNDKNVMLLFDKAHIDPIMASTHKREQQIMDVSTSVSSVNCIEMTKNDITDFEQLSEFVPGLYAAEQGSDHPIYSFRGVTNEPGNLGVQSSVAIYENNVPVNQIGASSLALFDMNRVEVIKGAQNTLFGKNAETGAIHYVSKMPSTEYLGKVTAGIGNYGQKEFRGMVNIPILEDKLFVRAAGLYNYHDGFVENTFGGDLRGKKTMAGRLSARFHPQWNHRLDLVVNYQKDDTPGVAFMPDSLPNANGITDIFSETASLEQGKNLGTEKNIFDAMLDYRFYINEHNYWTSITSYKKADASSRWDGDGTASEALDMSNSLNSWQLYQKIQGNFSQNSRLKGSLGGSFCWKKADQTKWLSTNEQHLANLFYNNTLVDATGTPNLITTSNGTALPTEHEEENFEKINNMIFEGFIDFSYQLTKRIFFSGGFRGIYGIYKLDNEANFTNGSESILGALTGNSPNVFYKPNGAQSLKEKSFTYNWNVGLKYRFREFWNVFANYSHGCRPEVLQFTPTGKKDELEQETSTNYELGFKSYLFDRVYFDVTGFYQEYEHYQSQAWTTDTTDNCTYFKSRDMGKAKAYGVEAAIRVAVIKQLNVFANYAWLNTEITPDSTTNVFRLAPEHSYTIGLDAHINITPNIKIFVVPSYSHKSHLFFDDANTAGLEQNDYGVLNINGGIELRDPSITLSVWAKNVLDEQYIASTGNSGSMFGYHTFVRGAPQTIGTKLTWNFSKKNKKRRWMKN